MGATDSLYPKDKLGLKKQLDSSGYTDGKNIRTKEENSVGIEERLESIEKLLKLLLLHAEMVTGNELKEIDIESRR